MRMAVTLDRSLLRSSWKPNIKSGPSRCCPVGPCRRSGRRAAGPSPSPCHYRSCCGLRQPHRSRAAAPRVVRPGPAHGERV
eukprot:2051198-Prymnesium_polylepis.1